ncbi:MAG TPA: hypothetical protein VGA55_02625 [Bacteroidota bacterium]
MTGRCLVLVGVFVTAAESGLGQAEGDDEWFECSAGLGIDAFSAPTLTDYINSVAQPRDAVEEFSTAVEFSVSPEFRVSGQWSAGLEYSYLIKSYSVEGIGGGSRFTYGAHLPFVIVHYVIPWENSRLKLGGGGGMVLASFEEELFGGSTIRKYKARGGGAKLEAVANSRFDDHFFGLFAVDLRWVFGGVFRDGRSDASIGEVTADGDYFTVGLKFGVAFVW